MQRAPVGHWSFVANDREGSSETSAPSKIWKPTGWLPSQTLWHAVVLLLLLVGAPYGSPPPSLTSPLLLERTGQGLFIRLRFQLSSTKGLSYAEPDVSPKATTSWNTSVPGRPFKEGDNFNIQMS